MPVELEPLGLELLDQPQPLDVLRAVETGATADLGRREQAARVMRAHVAHGHPGFARQFVDREWGHDRLQGTARVVLHHTT